MEQFKINLLKLVASHDLQYDVSWDENLNFFTPANDLFFWGCADAENIESQEDVDLLQQSILDCCAIDQQTVHEAFPLFCARKLKMRPQGATYNYIDKRLWPLFDACGEEREIDLMNPQPQPKEIEVNDPNDPVTWKRYE